MVTRKKNPTKTTTVKTPTKSANKAPVKPIQKKAVSAKKTVSKTAPVKKAAKPITPKASPKVASSSKKKVQAKATIKNPASKKAAPSTKKPESKTQTQHKTKQSTKEQIFSSTQAPMQFWQEMQSLIQQSLSDEISRQEYQHKLAESMQEIPKRGFSIPDPRLKASQWQSDPFYAQITQLYAYQSAIVERMIEAVPVANDHSKRKLQFLGKQVIEAASPANFAWSNPDFINRALETKGESLISGLTHLMSDVQKGKITHVDESQFEVGRNIANTPGKVVQRTPLYELIEYAPTTTNVSKQPMLFVPPCINKFYIMDLSPENSLVRYAVEQGHHLYLVSWRNIDSETQFIDWEHYIGSVIAAINYVREDNNGENCNVLGFCVGGTILSTTLAVMAAKNIQLPASVTLLTTLLDFSEPGDLGVFLSENLLEELEAQKAEGGIVSGSQLAQVFSILRPRDLVWNYVTQKYLKGEKPRDFDILYWNGDSTNLAVRMIAWYLRQCYWDNSLIHKEAVVLGEQVDLTKIDIPAYIYASREDHIVPWSSAYSSAQHLGSKDTNKRFVLGASGHIAGVINPAKANKRNYWLGKNNSKSLSGEPEAWLEQAKEMPGSWWNDWSAWLEKHKGGTIPARSIGYEKKKSLGDAPGLYVQVSIEQKPLEQVNDPMNSPISSFLEAWMGAFAPKNKSS